VLSLAVLAAPLGVVVAAVGPTPSGAASLCGKPVPITAAQSNSTTGITSKSVSVGNVSIIGGPVPGLFEGAPVGAEAYFDYVNSKGGVNGRKISLTSYDDGFSGQQNQIETQQAETNDFALVGSFSLFDSYGCAVLAQNPGMPDVSVTLDTTTNSLSNVYSAQPINQGLPLGPLIYLKKHYPKSLSLGALVSNAATAIAQWKGQEVALKHEGYKITYVRYVNPLETDFTTDIVHMRSLGVQTLFMTDLDWEVSAALIQGMTQQGWRPMVSYSGGPAYADQFIKTAGGAAANGVIIGQLQALYLGQDRKAVPAVNTFLTWVQKAKKGWTPDLYTLYGWASAQLFVQALKSAGPHPTRGKVLAELHKVTNFNASGLLAPGDPAYKVSPSCYILAKVVNQSFQRVEDPGNGTFRCDAPDWGINGKASYGPK
jgi:branched-chain amino acid transport system substrate-binding protein